MTSLYYASLLCLFFVGVSVISSDEVPTIFWNIKGNSFLSKPASALGSDDMMFKNSVKEVLDDNANILVFAVNRLSLEDFSATEKPVLPNNTLQNLQTFLDTQQFMFLSSVHDPLNHIHEAHCGVQEIVLDHSIDDNIMQSISQAFKKSCVVILHIMDSGIVGSSDHSVENLKKAFLPQVPEDSKNIVAVFTGMKSSWQGSVSDDHRIFRNLLATAEEELKGSVNITGCLLMYADNATLYVKPTNKSVNLPFPVDTAGSDCVNGSVRLQLNFKPPGENPVTVKLNFTRVFNSWTTVMSVEGASLEFEEILYSDDLEAAMGYSFFCGNYVAKNRFANVTVRFERFQVQPFPVNEQFSESFDCVGWFTIPIWMGIMVAILIIIIVHAGIYALYNVHTMDRFDDPKGQSISIGNVGD